MKNPFYNKSLLKLTDYSSEDIQLLLDISIRFKTQKHKGTEDKHLNGKNVALVFEKSSTRTRISFEVAAHDQGANVTYLGPSSSQIGQKESMKDTARVLGRAFDAIQYRGFSQDLIQVLADHSGVPVYNGLTDDYHPTQGLADLMTMMENSDKPLSEVTYCFVGDCRFNMANTLLLAGATMGMNVRLLCPSSLQPKTEIIERANSIATLSGADIIITDDKDKALQGCDFVHTDVWVSMGEAESVWEERVEMLRDYQVNAELMKKTQNPAVKFMHCLPAFHNRDTIVGERIYQQFGLDGLEVSGEIFESECSVVFDQSENRLHTIKSVMVATLVRDIEFIV